MMRKALVTGGTGFIGRALVARLRAMDWEVVLLTREGNSARPGLKGCSICKVPCDDLRTMGSAVHEILGAHKPDVIFHLATMQPKQHSASDVADMLMVNVGLGTHLMEAACLLGGIPFVNVGSYWQYFDGAEPDPVNFYAATKSALQEISKYYINARANPIANLILVDTYGEGDNRGKVLDLLIAAAISGKRLDLSGGEQQLDYIHVSDAVAGMVHAAEGLAGGHVSPGTYTLASGMPISLKALAAVVSQVTGREVLCNWGALPYSARQIMRTCIPHKTLPGWRAGISLVEGITLALSEHRCGPNHEH